MHMEVMYRLKEIKISSPLCTSYLHACNNWVLVCACEIHALVVVNKLRSFRHTWECLCVSVCCVQHVKIGCMNTFCQSTLMMWCAIAKRQVQLGLLLQAQREFYTNVQRCTGQCWCNIYIWSSFPTTMSSTVFFYEVVISIMHIKFPINLATAWTDDGQWQVRQ